jgi:hypothetical protein
MTYLLSPSFHTILSSRHLRHTQIGCGRNGAGAGAEQKTPNLVSIVPVIPIIPSTSKHRNHTFVKLEPSIEEWTSFVANPSISRLPFTEESAIRDPRELSEQISDIQITDNPAGS